MKKDRRRTEREPMMWRMVPTAASRGALIGCAALLLAGVAVAPGRADALLDPELRPKDKVPCAEALGTEQLLNAKETIPQIGAAYEDVFEEAVEKSDCKKDDILAFMRKIGAELDGTFKGSREEAFYFILKVYGDPWWLWWRPNVSIVLSFDYDGNLVFSGWGGRK